MFILSSFEAGNPFQPWAIALSVGLLLCVFRPSRRWGSGLFVATLLLMAGKFGLGYVFQTYVPDEPPAVTQRGVSPTREWKEPRLSASR